MQFRKTPFALAAIALCGAIPLGAQTSSTTIEAESMARTNYAIDGTRIKVTTTSVTGTATKTFTGASGTYNIQVHVLLENDGRPTLEVWKGTTTKLYTYVYPSGTTAATFTVSNVQLNNGDVIRLVGRPNANAYARVDKIVLTQTATAPVTPPAGTGYQGTPFSGAPIALPKAFAAADFDKGGANVAYRDLSTGNAGNLYRTSEDVDIIASTDAAGGPYAVNNFQTGEWMAYTVNVPTSGSYDLAVRAAKNQTGAASFHIEVDGANVTGSVAVPNTASWSTYQWVGKQGVNLTAGKHVLKVVSDQQYFNLNAVSVLAGTTPPVPVPPVPVPPYSSGVSFKTPAANQELSGIISQSAACEAVGTGITKVQFSLDSTPLNLEGGAPWQCNIDTTKFADGAHTLKAVATYTDGGTGSASIPVSIKNGSATTPPPPPPPPTGGTTPPVGADFFCSFESSPLDCGFSEQAKVAGRATLVDNPRRHGGKAVRLNTQPGDNNVSGSGTWERNDLSLGQAGTDCYQGREQWWGHSVLFPSDYVVPSAGGVVMDFHHTGSSGQANFHVDAMPFGLRLRGYGGTQDANKYEVSLGPVVKNQWYDFVYHVKWSSGSDGFMNAWVNGVQKLAHKGPTLYSGLGCYLKLANYHDAFGSSSSVIHDRVVRGTSPAAVSLTPLQGVP